MVDFHRSLRTATQNPFARNIATRSSTQYALNGDADRNRHGFRALFTGQAQQPANQAPTPTPAPANNVPAASPQPAIPTVESVFGPEPWIKDPGGVGPNGSYSYNPMQFATRATAEILAKMYGGTVVETDALTPYGPYRQNEPNELIQFSNGTSLNAGLVVSYFNRGYRQDQIDQMVRADIELGN